MAKQTVRGGGVKGPRAVVWAQFVAVGALIAVVSGCASTWYNPGKSREEAKADDKLCASEAEETALARAARQRMDYGRTQPYAPPGLNRGETPMQMQERSRTEDTYAREFVACMSTKGYTQDRPKAP